LQEIESTITDIICVSPARILDVVYLCNNYYSI